MPVKGRPKPPPPPQHPVWDGEPYEEEGEEEEDFEGDEEEPVGEDEDEEEEVEPPKRTKGKGTGKAGAAGAAGKPAGKAKATATKGKKGSGKDTGKTVKAKASGPGAKRHTPVKAKAKPPAKKTGAQAPKPAAKKTCPPCPSTPEAKPSVNFKDAMEKYQNSPTRKKQKVKEEAAEETSQDPLQIQRKMWNRFDRSLQVGTQRQSRAPKAPARIRDAIMSAPDGGARIDFFKLYCECGGDWGKVEAKHKKRESTRDGHGVRKRWLMLPQMIKLFESEEIALAMKALCMSEDGNHRKNPKLKEEFADQFLIEVEDDVFFQKFNEDETTYTAAGTLDMPSASRIAHGSESGAAGVASAASAVAEEEGAAEGGEAEAEATPPPSRRKGALPVDPTLEARKKAVAAKKAAAKVKVENPLTAMKVWLKNVQEDLGKMKTAQREASAPGDLDCGIPVGVATEFATFMQTSIPDMVTARAELQEVVDGDKPIHSLTAEFWQNLQSKVKEAHEKLNGWRILVNSYKSAKKAQEKAKSKTKEPAVPVVVPPPIPPAIPPLELAPPAEGAKS